MPRFGKYSLNAEIIAYGREFPPRTRLALAETEQARTPRGPKPKSARTAYLADIEEKLAREEMAEGLRGRRIA